MSKKNPLVLENIKLGKLVHGGQCIAEAPDGKKIFVWGGLPHELVNVRVTRKKSSYLEGIVTDVIEPSQDRVMPREPEVYLSSSPWQIMTYAVENRAKQMILEETFSREHIEQLPWQKFYSGSNEYGYRNKIELGFWGDEDGLHYASYVRGSHAKRIINNNALASAPINAVLSPFLSSLQSFMHNENLRAGDLKTAVFRSSQAGEVVAALFIKKEVDCSNLRIPTGIKGLTVYYSNPKSPASIPTKHLYITGDISLEDTILEHNITYDVLSFFQVNVPVFEIAATVIKDKIAENGSVDFYSGVGTIGVPVGARVLVDSDASNINRAKQNAPEGVRVIEATSETATDYIAHDNVLIVDPPRAGLHIDVIRRILEVLPPKVIYLSCNPSTQARDIKLLTANYSISYALGYNFFPRTPHIESLIVLEKK